MDNLSNKIWLHRISYHSEISYPLLEKGIITIGFSDFSSTDFINKSISQGKDYLESQVLEKWGSLRKSRFSLWKFIAEMSRHDLVIVPTWGSFSIFRIKSKAFPVTEEIYELLSDAIETDNVDLGFYRKVLPVEQNISRSRFADAKLTSRLKVRVTTAEVSDLRQSIENSINRARTNKPINLHSDLQAISSEQILDTIQRQLDPGKFEALIKWYFERIGATEIIIPAKNERQKNGDADVIAIFEHTKCIIYVQAKHHSGETSSWAVEQIVQYSENDSKFDDGYAKIPWVISTADKFSSKCFLLSQLHGVILISGLEFSRMILDAGIQNINTAFT